MDTALYVWIALWIGIGCLVPVCLFAGDLYFADFRTRLGMAEGRFGVCMSICLVIGMIIGGPIVVIAALTD